MISTREAKVFLFLLAIIGVFFFISNSKIHHASADDGTFLVTTSTPLTFSASQASNQTMSESFTITNNSASKTTLDWSVTSSQPWATFFPSSGSLAFGQSVSVQLIADPSDLGTAIYDATATITGSDGSSGTFPVTLTLNSTISGYPILNAERTFPSDTGMINVKTQFGAKGDGVTDDTAAIQAAMSSQPDATFRHRILYFPAGTYLVSAPILEKASGGQWESGITFQGENVATTRIKLVDNDSLYQNSSSPEDVLDFASEVPLSPTNGGGNDGFDNYIFDMGVDTGSGNPGAVAVDFLGNNYCGFRNVLIKSSDPNHVGVAGVSMQRYATGPCFMKNLVVDGFSYGITLGESEYSLTLEDIKIFNQQLYGIYNHTNIISIRDLVSTNSVPAIWNWGLCTVLNAILQGGSSNVTAIQNINTSGAGVMYARNITSSGYLSVLSNSRSILPGNSITEYDSGPVENQFDSDASSLNLPIQETPEYEDTNLSDWANVVSYGADPTGIRDSSAAVQAAIDSGATTVYFPWGTYAIGQTIFVRGNVRMIDGFDSLVNPSGTIFENVNNPTPLFEVMNGNGNNNVTINHIRVGRFVNNYLGAILVEQNSTRPLTMLNTILYAVNSSTDTVPSYENTSQGTGPLFGEDIAIKTLDIQYPQDVFVRQLNPEDDTTKVENNGGTLWVLGFKTEQGATNIETDNGGSTEVLGGLIYPLNNVPLGVSNFVINNSRASFVYGVSSYQANSTSSPGGDFQTQVTETQNGVTKSLLTTALPARGNGIFMPLYVSDEDASAPPTSPTVVPPVVSVSTAFPLSTSTATFNAPLTSLGNGSVTTVGFNYGTSTLYGITISKNGNFATGTFSENVTGLIPGTLYHLEAFAENSAGIGISVDHTFTTSGSAPTSSIPDTTPPTTSITSPTNNATVSSTITVSASASDNVGVTSVALYVDGVLLSTDTVSPYTFSLNTTSLTNGTHTLETKAYDAAGNVGVSTSISITVNNSLPDTTPPSVPTGLTATAVSPSQINLSWTASTDNVGVTGYKIYKGGVLLATSTLTTYSSTGLSPATTYSYTVSAYDAAGNVSAQSGSVSATTGSPSDTTPPTTSITSPTNNATVSSTITVSASASDNVGVTSVALYVDGVLMTTDTVSPYTFSLNTTSLTNGTHTLETKAYDAAGNVGTSPSITVTVTNAPQTLTATLTASNTSSTAPLTTSLTATAAGTASGTINYIFYCNRADASTSLIGTPDLTISGSLVNPYTATNVCTYPSAGTYTSKVIVERGTALPAQAQKVITVSSAPITSSTPSSTFAITAIVIKSITQTDVELEVTTNESSSIRIRYGLTTNYDNTTAASPELTTVYEDLGDLTPNTGYNFSVLAIPNGSTSTISSTNMTFTTLATPIISTGGGGGYVPPAKTSTSTATSTGSTSTSTTPTIPLGNGDNGIPTSTIYFPRPLSYGDTGTDVMALQVLLQKIGFFPDNINPTSYFGLKTEHAVLLFEGAHLLSLDGSVDASLDSLLNKVANNEYGAGVGISSSTLGSVPPTSTSTSTPIVTSPSGSGYVFTRYLTLGSKGSDVTALQQLLITLGDYPTAIVSGYYGMLTEKAVELFQSQQGIINYGLPYTTGYGAVGPRTRKILNEQ